MGAPGVASREASSPPARPRSSERGGSVSGHLSVARERASVSSAPSGAGVGEVARSQQMPPARAASLAASPRSSQHALRCLLWSAPICDPPMFPDLQIEEQGRIAEPAFGRTALVIAPVVLALLAARGQVVERVGSWSRLDRCPPANGRDVIGLGLRTAPDLIAFALGRGEIDRDPLIATGLAATALNVTGRIFWITTDHVDSIRYPLLVG